MLPLYSNLELKMPINIIVFGQLCEILGDNLVLHDIGDTDRLATVLNEKYPGLTGMKYMMAVDKKLVTEKTLLANNNTVALMPAFSGG